MGSDEGMRTIYSKVVRVIYAFSLIATSSPAAAQEAGLRLTPRGKEKPLLVRLAAIVDAKESAPPAEVQKQARAILVERADPKQGPRVFVLGGDYRLLVSVRGDGLMVSPRVREVRDLREMVDALRSLGSPSMGLVGRFGSMPAPCRNYVARAIGERYPLNVGQDGHIDSEARFMLRPSVLLQIEVGGEKVQVQLDDSERLGSSAERRRLYAEMDAHPLPLRIPPERIEAWAEAESREFAKVGAVEAWRVLVLHRPLDRRTEQELRSVAEEFETFVGQLRTEALQAAKPMGNWISSGMREFRTGPLGDLNPSQQGGLAMSIREEFARRGLELTDAMLDRAQITECRPHWTVGFAAMPSKSVIAAIPLTPR
jgi:hypothetical protein